MTRFIQMHLLTSYPPSNLNRDDLGQPKTARFGGKQRIRVSSQSLKRAWRQSECFDRALSGSIGTRTKRLGVEVYERLTSAGVKESRAKKCAEVIATVFGSLEKSKASDVESLQTGQLVHVAPEEMSAVNSLVDKLIAENREPSKEELDGLLQEQAAVDIAMFGRMLAEHTEHNVEAAVQVAHALGVHESAIEDDFFTAVDDLKQREDDLGAGHLGETGFASAMFYQYICVDRDLLERNLGGNAELASRAIRALAEAAHTVSPRGKMNSFASRGWAHFSLVEKGDRQPRSLSLAFLKPVSGDDYAKEAAARLIELREHFDRAYGPGADASYVLDVLDDRGTFAELLDFASET
jgi:CRISPR system Cascade subunit CasC